LLGYDNVIKWCRIFLLTLINPTDRGMELIRISTIRGYFLMNLKKFIQTEATEDELFILGLFSMLDALLDQPMEEILSLIPLDDLVKNTLLNKPSPLTPYLKIIKLQEQGRWQELSKLLKKLNLSSDIVTSCYSSALEQSNNFFQLN
jgi:EAL and modified HD-GYP domain-containing signal transduction protein